MASDPELTEYSVRVARWSRLDRAAAESARQLLAFERPPKWDSDRRLLARRTRLEKLREAL